MNEKILGQKYLDAAKNFEHLLRIFSEDEPPLLLMYYDLCISKIIELSSLEKDPMLLGCLENILTQIEWQQEHIREAYTSGSTSNTMEKIKPETCTQEEIKPTENKGSKNEKLRLRQETIKLAERVVRGDGLCDIIGLDGVKTLLKKSVLLPMIFPSLFTGGRKPWTQILLYGPPGTGKTNIAHALAAECKAQLFCVSSADLLSHWVGESEKMIKDLFEFTRRNSKKSIVFLDEIDSICRKRTSKESDHSRSIKNQLLIELDQNSADENKCIILCATNCPWDVDIAFLRRFQCRIYIPLPDRTARIELIKKACGEIRVDINSEEWMMIANKTEGYSGADLVHLTNFALQEPLEELVDNHSWIVKEDKWIPCPPNTPCYVEIPISLVPPEKVNVRDVLMKDFIKAIEAVPKTISINELERYNEYLRIN